MAQVAGSATRLLLWKRRFLAAQVGAGSTVVCTLAGFAAALAPDLVIGQLSLASAAAPRATLVAFLAALAVGVVILVPSLFYLYWSFRGAPPDLHPSDQEER